MIDSVMGWTLQAEWATLAYLANAVWQVPLVFAAAWAAAKLARRLGPVVEHAVWVLALLLEAGLPAARVNLTPIGQWLTALLYGRPSGSGTSVRVVMEAGTAHGNGLRLPASLLAGLAVTFAGSVLYGAARLVWGAWRTERMRRQAIPVILEGAAERSWRRCGGNARNGLARAAELRVSVSVPGPVTVGVLRPAVLVPKGFLEIVSGNDLESVLAHELAHVRRWDFSKNLLYEAISIAVAWHPVAWLTRARVAESREMVCDAIAAKAVAGNESYARSLLRLASLLADDRPRNTLHAIGIFDANSFERRVMNLTKTRVEMRLGQRLGTFAACAVMVVAACTAALALRVEVGPELQAVAASSEQAPVKIDAEKMQAVYKKPPVYPAEAKAKKDTLNGPVVLAVVIGKDGTVESIKVKKSLREDYDRSALDAVKDWRWEPYRLKGEPVEVDTTVTVNYSLNTKEDKTQPKTQSAATRGWDTAPKIVGQVDAVYPEEARTSNDMLDGSVILGVTVGRDGSMQGLHLDKSLREDYDRSAWATVKEFRFKPARSDGKPVEAKIEVAVNFKTH